MEMAAVPQMAGRILMETGIALMRADTCVLVGSYLMEMIITAIRWNYGSQYVDRRNVLCRF